jgi:tRNA(Arg) A34 adenosine deaminase TadA
MPTPTLRDLLGRTPLAWTARAGVTNANLDVANRRQLRGAVRRLRRHFGDDVAAVLVRGSRAVKPSGAPSVLQFVRAGAVPTTPHAPHDLVTALLQTLAANRGKSNFQRQLVTTCEPSVMARGMESLVVDNGIGIMNALADDPGDRDDAPDDEVTAWYAANRAAGTVAEVEADAVLRRDLTRFAVPQVPPPIAVNLLRDAAPLDLTREDGDANEGYQKVHRVYLLAAFALLKAHGEAEATDGKFVAALLVARDGRILSWGLNTNKANSTHHAEVNMLQAYYARQQALGAYGGLPAHARVYTTLQCCRMCAGMLRHCASEPVNLRVYYAVPDPGQNDGRSALQGAAPLERRLITQEGGLAGIEFIWSRRRDAGDHLGTDYSTRLERRMAATDGDAASKGVGIAHQMEHFSAHEELARKYFKYHRSPTFPVADHFARHETPTRNPQTRDAVRYAVAFLAGLGLD